MLFPFNSEADNSSPSPSDSPIEDAEFPFTTFVHESMDLNCKFYDEASFNKMISESSISDKSATSFFHLNINSLSLHIDDLDTFLTSLNFNFDIIGLSETRILSHST